MKMPKSIHGVDFSGARDAGNKIWIASGALKNKGCRITECRPAEELPGGGVDRAAAISALADFIVAKGFCAVGLDFPFGLPKALVKERTWKGFARNFGKRFPDESAFKEICVKEAGGRDLKRLTDIEQKTPFCPYNLRMFRQTYFGIRDLLAPLAHDGRGCVLPMMDPEPGKPWLLETCPASRLKKEGLYCPFKGREKSHLKTRERIFRWLCEEPGFGVDFSLKKRILADAGGDALDSVIAAFITFRALENPSWPHPPGFEKNRALYDIEGYVYS